MAKRVTKAERILNDAAMRLEAARIRQRTAEAQLNAAKAACEALESAYEALEKELTPKSRQKATPSTQANLPVEKEPICGACGNVKDFEDHIQGSPRYHEFEGPKAKRASAQK